jgi:tRNA (uracil-5-)-methyltransferase
VCNYEHVIYISCGQEALQRDLAIICKTHKVRRFAIMDQFAYSIGHIECGVYLEKI